MGTDVHAVWQAKKEPTGDYWHVPEGDWEQNRHYFLFAWLAGVRNGYGFAGLPSHDPVVPIAQPRGFPKDFGPVSEDGCHWGKWMGDHTYSWLTADEILAAPRPDLSGTVHRTGVISMDQYRAWDGKEPPDSFSLGVSGPGIVVATSPLVITDKSTHVQVEWQMPAELDYFIDEVNRMRAKHGPTLRLVFGFDS